MKRESPPPSNSKPKVSWSADIVILGKSKPSYSRKYGLVYCMAGVWKWSGEWVRLYPVGFEAGYPIRKFDIVRVGIREFNPEPHRPESLKIHPSLIKRVGSVRMIEDQLEILNKYTEHGGLLHGDEWRRRSLGLIKPIDPKFEAKDEHYVEVKYRCDYPNCTGHTGEVFDSDLDVTKKGLEELRRRLRWFERQELYFVMGTMAYHPHRWIIVAVHSFGLDEGILKDIVAEYWEARKKELGD